MLDGRFKVFNTCEPFFEEFRLYHRDENGKIVKLNDDVLSAVRYAYMMRRFAKMMRDIKTKREKDTSPNQAHRTENLNGRRKQTQFHSV